MGHLTPCQADPDPWFARDANTRAEAADACTHCPLLDACASYADTAAEGYGVWGGVDRETSITTTTPKERR